MRYTRDATRTLTEAQIPDENTWQRRALSEWGVWLILLGFLHGAWYAAVDLYAHEAQETAILGTMLDGLLF